MKWDSFKNVKSVFNFVKRLGAHRPLGIFSFNLINRKNSQVLESIFHNKLICGQIRATFVIDSKNEVNHV